ncbi:hypothetical protein ACMU_01410 [Actibacterium mucosum KCTC 23349]|uniref:Uncharacterized protein n=1 Tax=Actibacterium mucosum KCTC 23349 TaxID=1454373 RepID=A0A037ZNQ3_9RHOB|nr:hypothetical protein [Actibacterium mucosum]KAJ57178.1 hypothetical protein ACMU_01410 [Actibacterium mucosum KCTC 23349]
MIAVTIYMLATLAIIGLHLALVLGAPWGVMTMGGQVTGQLPAAMRVGSALQAMILAFLALVVAEHAGVAQTGLVPGFAWLIWLPVAVSGVSFLLNTVVTQSRPERLFGAPMTALLLGSSLTVALS